VAEIYGADIIEMIDGYFTALITWHSPVDKTNVDGYVFPVMVDDMPD
jgi:hypothetical protein